MAICSGTDSLVLAVDKVEVSKLYEVFMSLSDGGKTPLDRKTFKKGLGMLKEAGLKNLDDSPFTDR